MTTHEWRKLQRLFTKAKRLEGLTRTAFLDRTCQDDPLIRAELESLLGHHDRSSAFLMCHLGGKQTISHYKILERIGEGGMGLVYKARDTRLARLVALKVLPPWQVGSLESRERLLNEARLASRLNHPNIVTIHDIVEDQGVDFIVMEYLSGKILRELIPIKGLPILRVITYAISIADALSFAHEAEILHRDLKPSNIMVTDDGRVKLLDFGVALPMDSATFSSGTLVGTSTYMAPEQFNGGPADPRSEIFSFGLVLLEMLTGQQDVRPRLEGELAPAFRRRTNGSRIPRRVPQSLANIALKCLEEEPGARFQSMAEIAAVLRTCLETEARGSMEVSPTPPSHSIARSPDGRRLRSVLARMSYQSITESREAFTEIAELLRTSDSENLRLTIAEAMRALMLTLSSYGTATVPGPIREVRRLALSLLKLSTRNNIHQCLRSNDFEHLDLWFMDFSFEKLVGFSFKDSFLVEATFDESDLRQTSFLGANVRNVVFSGANLAGADFTDADWFNALGLTVEQLKAVQIRTLMRCPNSLTEFHDVLGARYSLSFRAWSERSRSDLLAAWHEYLRPDGLRDFVRASHSIINPDLSSRSQ